MTAQVTEVPAAAAPPLLAVAGVDVVLGHGWRASQVLTGVDLDIWPGEIVGLVGETGSGKTTLARTIVGLVRPRQGRIVFAGTEISGLRRGARRRERRSGHVQLVFQDPLRSLDPDLTVAEIVGEGLTIRGGLDAGQISEQVDDALAKVGLDAALRDRTPGQISGGQRQRVSIARALAAGPRLLLCDEPVSALDASNRNYILRLLAGLRDSLSLPIVIISHDLSSLAGIADRVVVLYRGRIVEDGPVSQVFSAPRHPYTALLMASAPSVHSQGGPPLTIHQLRRTAADPPPPDGGTACVFAARCPFAIAACAAQPPRPWRTAGRPPGTATSSRDGQRPRHHSRRARKETRSMPVEFIGMISTKDQSETRLTAGPVIDTDYVRRFARAHEDAGFDRVLIGYASSQPDGAQVAAYAAAHTERLSFLIAHRPGFVAPTLAARTFATLDQFTGGRIAVHIITGGSDAEQRRDGDHLTKDERYDRTDEYLDIVKQAWTAEEPFSYHGGHYQVEDFYSSVKSPQQPRINLYFGGSSAAAYRVGGKHADVYALWGEPLAETKEQIDSVNEAAKKAGRETPPRISVSFRPILGPTEELAWERAHRILEATRENIDEFSNRRRRGGWGIGGTEPENRGSQRLLAAAAKGELHDRALWTPLAQATGAAGNSTALVGTPETVAQALLDYIDIGVTTILIRGYDPYDDAIDYGRFLLPLVREEVARRDAEKQAVSA